MTESVNETNKESSGVTQAATEQPSELEALQGKLKEAENKYLYLYAEFENYKKRMIKERSDTIKFGWENQARDYLNIFDNLDRALQHLPQGADVSWAEGVKMVAQEMLNTFKKHGLEDQNTVGKVFDPHLHDAVGQEKSETISAGSVVREVQKGYNLHGRLLRPARVIISG